MKKIIISVFSAMLIFLSACGSTSEVAESSATAEKSSSSKASKESDKNLYKGAGLVIAVTAPEVRNGGKNEEWMPQFFQDSITGNFAKYSKMTVLDRANENLTKAEQELSESGFYTEENAVHLGQMTNAQYAVFGSILALSGSYELNFRAIDIATNEIKAAYNDRVERSDIESGASVNAIVQQLFEGLGIQLSAKEQQQLAKTDAKTVNATKSLAKGAAAEKADNLIEALAFYTEAQESGSTKKEATAGINGILGTDGTVSSNSIANLKAQAEYEKQQIEKWNKIFKDLGKYINSHGFIVVYDFSEVQTDLTNQVSAKFNPGPGAKVVPVRKAFLVAKQIVTEWIKVSENPANAAWIKRVHVTAGKPADVRKSNNIGWNVSFGYYCYLRIGLYDDSDYCIKETDIQNIQNTNTPNWFDIMNIKSQKQYFSASEFRTANFSVNLKELPDDSSVHVKPLYAYDPSAKRDAKYGLPIMSLDEYNEWAKNQ